MDYIKRRFSSGESQDDDTMILSEMSHQSTTESKLVSYVDISNSDIVNQKTGISKTKSKLLFIIDNQNIDW